jgi:hypothetical protein
LKWCLAEGVNGKEMMARDAAINSGCMTNRSLMKLSHGVCTVMPMRNTTKVMGEPLEILLQFLPYLKTEKQRNGMLKVGADQVPDVVGVPFLRALMRREAELLHEDTDELVGLGEPRTDDQRRADAFVDLIMRVVEEADRASTPPLKGA